MRDQVEAAGHPVYDDTPDAAGCFIERLDQTSADYRLWPMYYNKRGSAGPPTIRYNLDGPVASVGEALWHERELVDLCGIPWRHQRQALIGAASCPRKLVKARLTKEYTEAMPRRRHEVTGHWKHSRKSFPGLPGCEHISVKKTDLRDVCIVEGCGHKRWWVTEFMRGSAEQGFVIKDRVVETRD